MKLGETAGLSDAGRKRLRNEDSFVVEPPIFAVADGMGGAQAGEVASRLAAAALREFHEADELDAQTRVASIVREANRRIYERARADTQVSGMGTTITLALVEAEHVSIGHVGDSRAYLIRGAELRQLTQDHSLVADLVRSGRLTLEEAEIHPQRSVITRALGTDPDVVVDTMSIAAEPGDVVLLCSDGLTTMVGDDAILELVLGSESLEAAANALVTSANRSGGEDNITAVLFRLEDGEPLERVEEPREVAAPGDPGVRGDDLEDTLSGLEVPPAAETAAPSSQTVMFKTEDLPGWQTTEEIESEPLPAPEPAGRRERRDSRWSRRLLWFCLAVLFVLGVLAAAFWGISRANFIGAGDEGTVTIYRGVPWELGGGVDLYRARYVSPLRTVQLSPAERAELFDHSLIGYAEARALVRRYEEESVPESP